MDWDRVTKLVRKRGFLKQEALADLLGVRQSTISRWESGETVPRKEIQKALQNLLAKSQLNSAADRALAFRVRLSENMFLIDRSMIFREASEAFCRICRRSVEDVVGQRNNEKLFDDGENLRALTQDLMRKEDVVLAKALNGVYDISGNLRYTVTDFTPIVASNGDSMILATPRMVSKEEFEKKAQRWAAWLRFWTPDDVD